MKKGKKDNMPDTKKGIYKKYRVQRTDGRSAKGEKHHDCFYFVLDTDHDPYAITALRAYAEACRKEYPLLADDIETMLGVDD